MSARIAVLVLAHLPAPLSYLLRTLDERFRVFVHMDAKAGETVAAPPGVRMIAPRIDVFWGGWSMMRATLALIAAAREEGGFRRYVLVSGDSLPVVASDLLAAALLDEDREFVDLVEVPDDPSLAGMDMQEAIARHGWVQPWRRHNPEFWDHVLLNPFQRESAARRYGLAQDRADWIRGEVSALMREVLAGLRPADPYPRFFYGAQWWGLTAGAIEAVLAEAARPEVRRFFRAMQVPDEHMIQTILGNRPDMLAGRKAVGTMMWTDHARRAQGQDRLDDAGFRAAPAQGRPIQGRQVLFARKFDPEAAPGVAAAISEGRWPG
jgi:hypothetical protein